jgi:uncharacterized membrane protein YqjE
MMSQQAGEIVGYIKEYGEKQVKLMKLDIAERVSRITSGLALMMVAFVLLLFVLLLLSIAVGIYLGEVLDSYAIAFLCLSGFYLIVGVTLIVFKKSLVINPILEVVINEMMNQDEE